jgi:hypothetical protein
MVSRDEAKTLYIVVVQLPVILHSDLIIRKIQSRMIQWGNVEENDIYRSYIFMDANLIPCVRVIHRIISTLYSCCSSLICVDCAVSECTCGQADRQLPA